LRKPHLFFLFEQSVPVPFFPSEPFEVTTPVSSCMVARHSPPRIFQVEFVRMFFLSIVAIAFPLLTGPIFPRCRSRPATFLFSKPISSHCPAASCLSSGWAGLLVTPLLHVAGRRRASSASLLLRARQFPPVQHVHRPRDLFPPHPRIRNRAFHPLSPSFSLPRFSPPLNIAAVDCSGFFWGVASFFLPFFEGCNSSFSFPRRPVTQ